MAVLDNTIKAADIAATQDKLFVARFNQEVNQLVELLGLFGVETMTAGQFFQYKVTGKLNEAEREEGDETPLSHYKTEKVSFGEIDLTSFHALTTGEAIAKRGYANAVVRTDEKFLKDLIARNAKKFVGYLKGEGLTDINGGSSVTEVTKDTFQATLAHMIATLGDKLEDNNDRADDSSYVWFVNRTDIADYLADKEVTMQTLYGMNYIKNFLGIASNVFVTNKIDPKTIYVTPAENIHVYGLDFGELELGGLSYETDESGLIGIHHEPNYNRVSCETYAIDGLTVIPEVIDYIVKGTITPLE